MKHKKNAQWRNQIKELTLNKEIQQPCLNIKKKYLKVIIMQAVSDY